MRVRLRVVVVAAVAAAVALASVGCGARSVSTTTAKSTRLTQLQRAKYVTARLFASMSFEFEGQTVEWPTELIISSVPVNWMGQVFNGKVEANGLVDQVHGGVSGDGEWLLSFSYTRSIVRTQDVISYTVVLRNVPITPTDNSTAVVALFDRQDDVRKYVEDIQYKAGGVTVGSWKETGANYTSTDWNAAGTGVRPKLKVAFETVPSQDIGSGPAPGGM